MKAPKAMKEKIAKLGREKKKTEERGKEKREKRNDFGPRAEMGLV